MNKSDFSKLFLKTQHLNKLLKRFFDENINLKKDKNIYILKHKITQLDIVIYKYYDLSSLNKKLEEFRLFIRDFLRDKNLEVV